MFLAAAGTNALVIMVYSKLKPDQFNNKVKEKYRKLSDDRSLLRGTCLGAAMLGFGMKPMLLLRIILPKVKTTSLNIP